MGGRLSRARIPRIITAVCVFLLLGAIINVAVAWGCAYWVSLLDRGSVYQGWITNSGLTFGREWLVSRRDAFGSTRVCATPQTTRFMLAGGAPAIVLSDLN